MTVAQANIDFMRGVLRDRLGDPYIYGGVWSPTDANQGCDCSGAAGTTLEALTKGPDGMNWDHDVSTESWFFDYNTGTPSAPGTVGPYGTIAVGSLGDIPGDMALVVNIMHGGGGENSHMNAVLPDGTIIESNGNAGTCTNGTGGNPSDASLWTDHWYLPGPITGDSPMPQQPPQFPQPPTDVNTAIMQIWGALFNAIPSGSRYAAYASPNGLFMTKDLIMFTDARIHEMNIERLALMGEPTAVRYVKAAAAAGDSLAALVLAKLPAGA